MEHISIERAGKVYTATYEVDEGILSLDAGPLRAKATHVGALLPRSLARLLLGGWRRRFVGDRDSAALLDGCLLKGITFAF